jgi:uncharacterized protein
LSKALIVYGGWEGHAPKEGADIVAGLLRTAGLEVEQTTDFSAFGRAADYDLVVPNITWHTSMDTPVDPKDIDRLVAAVRAGTGFGTFHGSAVAFPTIVNYHFMMGSQWVQHPGDNGIAYRIHVEKPFDPVMEGISDFDYRSEQYYLHVDPSIDVLATTLFTGEHDDAVTGIKMPAVYKRQFGKGRVFYSSLGHAPSEWSAFPAAKTILERGLLWAARRS